MIVIPFSVCYNLFRSLLKIIAHAAVAELADAYDSKSYGKPYGFESHQRHLKKGLHSCRSMVQTFLFLSIQFSLTIPFLTDVLVLLPPCVIEEHDGTDHHDNADKVCKYCKGQ